MANASAKAGVAEMELLFTYLDAYQITDRISFDLSLARGLDYYTGIIYEAIVEASAPPAASTSTSASPAPPSSSKKPKAKTNKEGEEEEEEIDESQVGVGSIAAGGRYDNLVSLFSTAAGDGKKKGFSIPCVGVSIGLERVFAVAYQKWVEKGMRNKETEVFVMAAGDGLLTERIRLVQELRQAGLKVCLCSVLLMLTMVLMPM